MFFRYEFYKITVHYIVYQKRNENAKWTLFQNGTTFCCDENIFICFFFWTEFVVLKCIKIFDKIEEQEKKLFISMKFADSESIRLYQSQLFT